MGTVDWGALGEKYGAPTAKGPVDWNGVGGTYMLHVPKGDTSKPSSGGGGLLGSIEGAVSGAAHGLANFGEGSLRGFYNIGHAAVQDVANHPWSLSTGPFAPLAASGASLLEGGGGGHLGHDVAIPIAKGYAAKYGPVFEHPLSGKSYRGIEKDPFGTALDVASLGGAFFTGGESAILRGTALGERLGAVSAGSRAARLADRIEAARAPLAREVETVRGSGVKAPYTVDAARSPVGRAIQRHVTLPLKEGPLAHVPGIGAGNMPIRNYREQRAFAEAGDQAKLREFERGLTGLNRAEHTAIHVAAEGDRSLPPSMWRQQRVDFYRKQLEDTVDKGARKDLERQLRILGADNPKLAAKIDKALTNPRPALLQAYERGRSITQRSAEAAGFKPETSIERGFVPADVFGTGGRARAAVAEAKAAGGFDHPFGENYVFPHRGPPMPRSNAISITKTNMPAGKIQRTIAQHTNQGIREATGRIFTSPSVITHDAMANLRLESAEHFQGWAGQHAVPIPETGVPDGWTKFNPEGLRGHRALLERGAYTDDMTRDRELEAALHDTFSSTSEQRPLMVPTKYAKAVQQEFARTGTATRLLIDKPMQVWRAAVLKYRPAWLVNNIVGQHMLYFLHAGGPAALLRYMQMLRVERGEGYAQNALLKALRVPALRFKYLHMLDETGAHGARVASTSGILGGADRFAYTRRGQFKEARPVPYAVAAALPRLVKSIGDANARLNQLLADDLPRGSKFIVEARRSPALRRVGQEMADSMSPLRKVIGPSTEDLLRNLTDEERLQILRKVNQALGDFNNLSPLERGKIRRVMPFYSWFKAIGVISKDLVVHHPEKVNLLRNLEIAANQNPGIMPRGQMPSWLQGAIATSAPNQGVQEMLTAVGLNPFQTPVQVGQAAAEIGGRLVGHSTKRPSDALGLLGPGFELYDLFQGTNPLTGQATKQNVVGGFTSGLPQVRLAQGLGVHIPGLAPYKPAKTYENNKADLIYQYLGIPRRHVRLAKANQYAAEGF